MQFKNKTAIWMMISGLTGLSLFLIANFSDLLNQANIVAGILQISVNAFVFYTWLSGFRQATGFAKFVALIGTIVPVIMAFITIFRVLLPYLTGS